MGRLTIGEMLLANLREQTSEENERYLPKEVALRKLIELYGQNFGMDSNAWEQWLKENTNEIINPL